MRRRAHRYSCGGPMSYEGSCGAGDCARCHPEWNHQDSEDDMREDDYDARADWEYDKRRDERAEREVHDAEVGLEALLADLDALSSPEMQDRLVAAAGRMPLARAEMIAAVEAAERWGR